LPDEIGDHVINSIGAKTMKLNQVAFAVVLAFPMLASAQSNAELQSQIQELKAQIIQLRALVTQGTSATSPSAPADQSPPVDPAEFNQVKVKVESIIDQQATAGIKGLRISGGFDPVYMVNSAKGTSSFAFLNNFTSANGSGEIYTYDNSYFGLAYLDFQKEMDDGGTKFRLTLAPSKSAGSGINFGNIVHEASASIPLTDPQTRLIVGQMPDVSGYEPYFNTFVGANSVTSNLLYPGYGEYFITKNMLFDFTAATAYTGVGLDITRGPWETKLILANFNSARNDCPVTPVGAGASTCGVDATRSPTLIYNVTYAQDEFWGFEFTGYEGSVTNWVNGGSSRLSQFEIDGNYTRGNFNGNLQATVGRQADAGLNGAGDAQWWGLSALVAQRVTPQLTLAARADYLNNDKNGGGNFGGGFADGINGFGAGDTNAPGYDANVGANRYALSVSATYRLTTNVALRTEYRRDHSTTPSFKNYSDQSYRNSNETVGLQAIVNF
jgi:hypothetical protein